jgi:metallo-beta-lactamase family protein
MRIVFLGAAGTVTGSKYLVETGHARILVDCGLFQGLKELRERNWADFPVPPASIDAVVLTHAHLDHSGYLPLLVRNGFRGPVVCTASTRALCAILLPDSGYLQEQDASFLNRHGISRHKPALPLYTLADAEAAMRSFRPVEFGRDVPLPNGFSARFLPAGHILGAAIVELTGGGRKIVFSGDLGRPNDPIMPDPAPVANADYLLVESTYGDRKHPDIDPADALLDVISRTFARAGTILIPAFAVGRTQTILYHLWRLRQERRLGDVPIFLDSPMAVSASDIFCTHVKDHRLSAREAIAVCDTAHYVSSVEESKELDKSPIPKIIVSASGMATGGRVLHHLKRYGPDPKNTILFAGYQAAGTRGDAMVNGAKEVKIHGEMVPVRAEVDNLSMLSAHADADEIVAWLRNFRKPPRATFIVHGEANGAEGLRRRIEQDLDWRCTIPAHLQAVDLGGAEG